MHHGVLHVSRGSHVYKSHIYPSRKALSLCAQFRVKGAIEVSAVYLANMNEWSLKSETEPGACFQCVAALNFAMKHLDRAKPDNLAI